MTPWSVSPIAGIPSSAARDTIAGMRLAPSSSEYSVWLWRWTKVSGACGIVWILGVAAPPDSLLGAAANQNPEVSNRLRGGRVKAGVVLRLLLGLVIWTLGPGPVRLAFVKLHHNPRLY